MRTRMIRPITWTIRPITRIIIVIITINNLQKLIKMSFYCKDQYKFIEIRCQTYYLLKIIDFH